MLFYEWKTSINDSFHFFKSFSRNHFLYRGFTFQYVCVCVCVCVCACIGWVGIFRLGALFLSVGGTSWRAIGFDAENSKKKSWNGEACPPTLGNPSATNMAIQEKKTKSKIYMKGKICIINCSRTVG